MNLAMEIPTAHLEEFSTVTDVDFALAHLVLEDSTYAEFFKDQGKMGRRVVLDNSLHELQAPLTNSELLEAARKIRPSVLIAPDKHLDARFTHEQFHALRKDPKCAFPLGLVLQGKDEVELSRVFEGARPYLTTLCLPYRHPRSQWYSYLVRSTPVHAKWPTHLHLLGVNTLEELTWFSGITENHGWRSRYVTVDTAKPLKWAIAGKFLGDLTDLRGGGLLDHSAKMTDAQRGLAFRNIAFLRRFMV